jgi:hypothetical protein
MLHAAPSRAKRSSAQIEKIGHSPDQNWSSALNKESGHYSKLGQPIIRRFADSVGSLPSRWQQWSSSSIGTDNKPSWSSDFGEQS